MQSPTILFVPVSSKEGVGEYMRSLVLAHEIKKRWPKATIHFILNQNAPYSDSCPYITHLSHSSATKSTPKLKSVIDEISPNLVIFDCSGRGKQFKYAKAAGAKVIFISQHKHKRAKGLKISRLLNTDLHWVVQPDYAISALTAIEKLKIKLFNRPRPKNIGPIFSKISKDIQLKMLKTLNLKKNEFFLFNAGSGGHFIGNELAANIFYDAAKQFQTITGTPCLMVFGSNYPDPIPKCEIENVTTIQALSNDEFIALLDAAKGRVISAGDTILQTIELKKPSVAAPVAKDQPIRLQACDQLGVVVKAKACSKDLIKGAQQLLDKAQYRNLEDNMNQLQPLSALDRAAADIEKLMKT